MELIIDEEFSKLLPPHTPEEYAQLEVNIKEQGCKETIKTWNNIICDGYTRYNICKKHNIKFATTPLFFNDRNEVKEWIIRNQFGRRNISTYDKGILALKLKDIIAAKAKERMLSGKKIDPSQNFGQGRTDKELAKIAGISHDTIHKIEVIDREGTPEIKQIARKSIDCAYKEIKNIKKKQHIKEVLENLDKEVIKPKQDRPSKVFLLDPPWKYDFSNNIEDTVEYHYPPMELDEIIQNTPRMGIPNDAILFLWATAPKLLEALELMNAWGFTYKTHAIWDKEVAGIGFWFRGQHELLLVGTKGKASPPQIKEFVVPSVFKEKKTKHSKKPLYFYEIIEKYFPEEKGYWYEMYAREKRKNWIQVGNELESELCVSIATPKYICEGV
jgi:N6-adenosine-specific RNA methylase IME4